MSGTSPYLSAETAIETLTCFFFNDDRTIADALLKPLAPAAALVLCLIANGNPQGLSRIEAQFGLRFAFNLEEATQLVDAGFAAAIEASLATICMPEAEVQIERLRLTDQGQRMIDNLQNVLKPGWE